MVCKITFISLHQQCGSPTSRRTIEDINACINNLHQIYHANGIMIIVIGNQNGVIVIEVEKE